MADEQAKVVIVGAGFSGLCMAIRLRERGFEDFVVLESADDVGGTWQHNTYPGCRCDVPSHLYSFSFAPNPSWSSTYSPQKEIHDYLRECATRFGVRPHLRTGVRVEEASWREGEHRWEISTSAGTFTSQVLVSGTGPLHEPMFPDLPGIESFAGKTMHSARWDHDYDLAGKRVASIGTGASAIQYVPEIQPEVEQLHVFQRTAPWVMPHGNRPIRDSERWLFRQVPLAQRLIRGAVYTAREVMVLGFAKEPRLMGLLERLGRSHMQKQLAADPEMIERVTPDYSAGCKRLLPSNRWYRALSKPNVELVTAGIEEVREGSIVDSDGIEREVDAIVFGTGFHVTDMPFGEHVYGREGRRLGDVWRGSPRAYLGTSVPGFPNLFFLLGPNTGLGHGSMVYMSESQVEHVLGAITALDGSGASTIEVRENVHAAYNADVDAAMEGTVWDTGGCTSFYLDDTGRNATLWPDFTWRFRRRARFDEAAYEISSDDRAPVAA